MTSDIMPAGGETRAPRVSTPTEREVMAADLARAYDAVAADYDRQLAGDAWMRRILWDHYARVFRPGQRVLDVGCGTGTDSIYLAHRGIRVTALDVSPGMIARLRDKVARAGVADRVDARVHDFAALGGWEGEPFDGIISAFAGLNSVPDLRPFAVDAARLLRPGGHLVVHLLNRVSLWEWLGLVRRGAWERARTLDRQSERCFVVGGVQIRQYPLAPDEAYARFFAPWFRRDRSYGLGILRPPHTVRRIPGPAIAALERLEARTREIRWLRDRGRLFVLDLVRRETEV